MRSYIKFKSEFVTEEYVKGHLSRTERSLLSQFRLGVLPLRIEVGRFRNEEVNERVCEICTLLEIEDEEHFVCVCPAYDQFRQILFNTAREINNQFDTLTTRNKFICNGKCLESVAKFVKDAWHQRKRRLFVAQ